MEEVNDLIEKLDRGTIEYYSVDEIIEMLEDLKFNLNNKL